MHTHRRKIWKKILIFTVLCLGISTPLWYLAYSNQEADYAVFCVMLASFLPAVLTLVITKITKEGWDNLGIAFNLKKSWKIYLLSMFGTTLLPYLADPLMLLLFPENVTTTFTPMELINIVIVMLIGTACFIECLGEELGWIGYLFPRLEKVLGTMPACVALGVIRATWHIGILVMMDYPVYGFIELLLSNVFLQSFMVYMFKKSGSLFPCTISHGISNLMPIFLVYDSSWYYTSILPMVVCLIPVVVYGVLAYLGMKKANLLCKKVVTGTTGVK